MPVFRTHTLVNLGLSIPLGVGIGIYKPEILIPTLVGYGISTLLLSPDLDLYTSTISRNWKIFRPLIWGYSKLFKHGQFSHKPFLGTFSRYLYVILVAIFITLAARVILGMSFGFSEVTNQIWVFLFWMFVGSCVADLIHEFLDFIITDGELRIKHRH